MYLVCTVPIPEENNSLKEAFSELENSDLPKDNFDELVESCIYLQKGLLFYLFLELSIHMLIYNLTKSLLNSISREDVEAATAEVTELLKESFNKGRLFYEEMAPEVSLSSPSSFRMPHSNMSLYKIFLPLCSKIRTNI